MSVHFVTKDELFPAAARLLKNVEIVLDIGCGIRPQDLITPRVHICVEPFYQYVNRLQQQITSEFDRSYVIVNCTWKQILDILPEKSVDSVFLLDIVEHLEKEKSLELLKRTEKIARNQIAIFTTLGFIPQNHPDGKDAWGLDGGKWQEHKSGWQPQDFGADYEIFVSRDYHTCTNLGKKYETPHGALWAIKNILPVIGKIKQVKETPESLSLLNEGLQNKLKTTRQALCQSLKDLETTQKELDSIHASLGWKVFAGIRRVKKKFKSFK